MNRYYNTSPRLQIPPVTLNLLIINLLCYVAQLALPRIGIDLTGLLGLHYITASDFHLWQPVTYMFLHGGFTHLFFNMFALFMFGVTIERTWGSKRYLLFYLVCGVTAALSQEIVWGLTTVRAVAGYDTIAFPDGSRMTAELFVNQLLTIGASGAVFGLLLAFGWLYPNAGIFLLFIPIPIKAKYFVIGYGLLELFLGVTGSQSGVAHFAHLGGMLGGLLLILLWRKQGKLYNAFGQDYRY